jgi:hypothetical protein
MYVNACAEGIAEDRVAIFAPLSALTVSLVGVSFQSPSLFSEPLNPRSRRRKSAPTDSPSFEVTVFWRATPQIF